MTYLWEWFSDPITGLHATRQSSGMGVSRLSRAEIHDWERDERVDLADWERKALMAVDHAWVAGVMARMAADAEKRKRENRRR